MRKRHFIAKIGVGIVCAVWAIALKAQPSPAAYSFGTVVVAVPAPADYVEVFSDNPQLREYFAGPMKAMADVLAGYVSGKALLSFQQTGRPQEIESFALLGTSPELRGVDVGEDTFEAMAKQLRTGLGDALRRSEHDIAAVAAEIGKRIEAEVGMQSQAALGAFDDGPNRIGILLATQFTFNGSPISIISANTLIRVRGRLLFAYVYTRNLQPEAVTALASVAWSWTDAIFAVNGQAPPRRQR